MMLFLRNLTNSLTAKKKTKSKGNFSPSVGIGGGVFTVKKLTDFWQADKMRGVKKGKKQDAETAFSIAGRGIDPLRMQD